jgi:hypothetical protein
MGKIRQISSLKICFSVDSLFCVLFVDHFFDRPFFPIFWMIEF